MNNQYSANLCNNFLNLDYNYSKRKYFDDFAYCTSCNDNYGNFILFAIKLFHIN